MSSAPTSKVDSQTITYTNPQSKDNRPQMRDDSATTYADYLKQQKKLGQQEAELLSKEDWLLHKRIKTAAFEQQLLEQEQKEFNTRRAGGQKQFRSLDQLLAKIDQNQKSEIALKKKFIPDLALQYQKMQKDVLSKVGQVKYAAMNTPMASAVAKPLTKGINVIGEGLGLPPAMMFALKGITKPMELMAKGADKVISKGTNKFAEMRHDSKAASELAKHSDEFKGNKYAAMNYVKQRKSDMNEVVGLQNKQSTLKEMGVSSSVLDSKIAGIMSRLAPKTKEPADTASQKETKLKPVTNSNTKDQKSISMSALVSHIRKIDTTIQRTGRETNKTLSQILTKVSVKPKVLDEKKVTPSTVAQPSQQPQQASNSFLSAFIGPALLKPIMDMIEGFKSFGSMAMSVGKGIFSVVKWLGRINPWVLGISALVASLDFEKDLFEPIQDIIKTFTDGDWLSGIGKIFTFIPQTIGKGVLRIGAWFAELLGFDDVGEKLKSFADNFDLFGMLKGLWSDIFDGIGNTLDSVMKSLSGFSVSIPAIVPDAMLSAVGIPREIKPFAGLMSSNIAAPSAAPSVSVGAKIDKTSVDVADTKSTAPIIVAPSTTTTTVVDSRSSTTAIGMRPRPRYKDESIMRHNRDSWSSAGGYSV